MSKNFYLRGFLFLMLLLFNFLGAQDLGLATGGRRLLNELARAFPIIVAIIFIWVGWKALSEYSDSKDVLASLKIVGWFLLAVFFVIGVYKVIKTFTL